MTDNNLQVRVLLVEDSKRLAEQLLELLHINAYAVGIGVVDTEKEAISKIVELTPDLLILDLHLREGTGFGVLKALTAAKKLPVTVVLTNYALPQYREQALALGARYFLDKNNDFDKLPDLIQEIAVRNAPLPN